MEWVELADVGVLGVIALLLAKYGPQIAEGHVRLMATLSTTQERQTATLEALAAAYQSMASGDPIPPEALGDPYRPRFNRHRPELRPD